NQRIVEETGMINGAVVPLLTPNNVVLGTVHVERMDGLIPTKEEVADLEQFGRKLAVAIEQSDRVNMLQSALDKQRDPAILLDQRQYLRYANRPAAEYLHIDPGWQASDENTP